MHSTLLPVVCGRDLRAPSQGWMRESWREGWIQQLNPSAHVQSSLKPGVRAWFPPASDRHIRHRSTGNQCTAFPVSCPVSPGARRPFGRPWIGRIARSIPDPIGSVIRFEPETLGGTFRFRNGGNPPGSVGIPEGRGRQLLM